MEITVIEKFDSMTLKVKNPNFSVRLNRYSESCSGDITEATFSNIIKFIALPKWKNYLEAFNALKDEKLLKTLIVEPKKVSIGQTINIAIGKNKTLLGTVLEESNAYFLCDTNMGKVKVQKSMLL